MDKHQRALTLSAILLILVATTQCAKPAAEPSRQGPPQGNDNVTALAFHQEPPPFRVEAQGEVAPFYYAGGDLRAAVASHPAPKVWLVYRASGGRKVGEGVGEAGPPIRVELPPKAETILAAQWEVSVAAEYDWQVVYVSDVRRRTQLSAAIINSSMQAARNLTEIQIDAPEGTRTIKYLEACELVQFVGKAVVAVVEQAKNRK